MPEFNGVLRSNEIFAPLFNMIISQHTFGDNVEGTYSEVVDMCRVDGSLYGDTKLYYATDILKSSPWGNDAEATNLLVINRPKAPKQQAIVIDVFRQISLTIDYYLSKRAWGDEGSFTAFTSIMLQWIRETKRVYDSTLVNTFIGTSQSASSFQTQEITLPSVTGDQEKENRLQAQTIAEKLANLMVEIKDISRNYNDYKNLRSRAAQDLVIIWNSEAYNKILKIDLPTIFHKDGLMEKLDEKVLPARYFGRVNTSGGTAGAANITIRSMYEADIQMNVGEALEDGRLATANDRMYHVFSGDLWPSGKAYAANQTYTEDGTILFKIMHKRSVPYMSAFEVGTSFFNPKSLTENHYLTFGHNTLEYLKNYPFITIRGTEA